MSSRSLEMLHWVRRVLDRYRPPDRSSPAYVAWRQGQAGWRSYYIWQTLWGKRENDARRPMIRRIVDAMRISPITTAVQLGRRFLTRAVPPRVRFLFKRLIGLRPFPPPLKQVRIGDLDRTTPVSFNFGFDRGTPVDRYYIEAFLAAHRGDIRGRALEVRDASYCCRFGKGIVRQDILDIDAGNSEATIVGDLSVPGALPERTFDCLVVTQTLQLIYDLRAAVVEMYRALKPGGVLLLTCPGISQIDRGEEGSRWCWSLTRVSAERMFSGVFGVANVNVETRGNVYAAVCFLEGLALEEVDAAKLDILDTSYPVIVAVRARKPEEA